MDSPADSPYLSIVIPAFNEEDRLPASLERVASFVKTRNYTVEVIVVDNASTDDTASVIADFSRQHPFIRPCREDERGKGAAVRRGVLRSQGAYVLISDADLAVPIEEIERLLPPELAGCDIAIGSREAPGAKRHGEPRYRHLMGRVFNIIVRGLVLPGIRDTQCGFKCFRGDLARELFAACTISGWGFDVEVLAIANIRGYSITEVPVEWYYSKQSKISPVEDSWRMFLEASKIRRNIRLGVYGRKGADRP